MSEVEVDWSFPILVVGWIHEFAASKNSKATHFSFQKASAFLSLNPSMFVIPLLLAACTIPFTFARPHENFLAEESTVIPFMAHVQHPAAGNVAVIHLQKRVDILGGLRDLMLEVSNDVLNGRNLRWTQVWLTNLQRSTHAATTEAQRISRAYPGNLHVVRFLVETAWYFVQLQRSLLAENSGNIREELEEILFWAASLVQIQISSAVQHQGFRSAITRLFNGPDRIYYLANLRRIFCTDGVWVPPIVLTLIESMWQEAVVALPRSGRDHSELRRKLMSAYETRGDICTTSKCKIRFVYYRKQHTRSGKLHIVPSTTPYDHGQEVTYCALE
jgi:hypothetical protein